MINSAFTPQWMLIVAISIVSSNVRTAAPSMEASSKTALRILFTRHHVTALPHRRNHRALVTLAHYYRDRGIILCNVCFPPEERHEVAGLACHPQVSAAGF